MKRFFLALGLLLTFSLFWASPAQAVQDYNFSCTGDPNDFYFEDFTADYYLTKDDQGISHLRVVEKLTAVFPECDQNRGIVREIPFTNQAGINITLPRLDASDFSATRNGQPENIAKIERNYDSSYAVYLGNADEYVYGQQEYLLKYEFEKVVTDFTNLQELYWDTNGTGWAQPFGSLTANLHIASDIQPALKDEAWCYVGTYGQSGQDRCYFTRTDNGYSFSTFDLAKSENLTFVVQFNPNTFTIPEPPKNWLLVIFAVLEAGIFILIGRYFYKKTWRPTAEKRHWYKYAPVAPQYSPLKGYTVGEMAAVYLRPSKNSKVATLLELAVANKISLRKEEGTFKKTWYIKVKSTANLTAEQLDVIKAIANQSKIEPGTEYQVKSHSYSDTSARVASNSYDGDIRSALKKRGLIEKKSVSTSSVIGAFIGAVLLATVLIPLFATFVIAATIIIQEEVMKIPLVNPESQIIGYSFLPPYMIIGAVIFAAIMAALSAHCARFKDRTMSGLELSIYMEGLRHYISLAEAARIEFLQSVKGADTTPEGIVKLHEKLLPYAIVFGVEQSWMRELAHYYETMPETSPGWYIGAGYLSTKDFSSAMSSVRSSSYVPSSSGGSSGGWSSGSSGGGGGGFSGGGGGGGGGGGW